MPRYFFHQRTPRGLIEDPDGSDLPDLDAARDEALAAARDLWASAILGRSDRSEDSFEIHDGHGRHLLTVPLIDALPEGLRSRRGSAT